MSIRKGETSAEHYARTKARTSASQQRWRQANPEKVAEYGRRWREKNPEKVGRWQRENPEKASAKSRRWRAAHLEEERERAREYARAWRRENAEHVRTYARERRQQDPGRARDVDRRRAESERRKLSKQAGRHTRKARQRLAPGKHTAVEWKAKLAEFRHRCAWCGTGGKMTCDHVIPVARGGANSIANVVPACMPCNATKSDALPETWVERRMRAGLPVTPWALGLIASLPLASGA